MDPTSLFNLNPWTLFLGFVFSVIGFAYYRYGKRQNEPVMLGGGIALMIYPLFTTSPLTIVIVGLLLMAGPFVAKRVGGNTWGAARLDGLPRSITRRPRPLEIEAAEMTGHVHHLADEVQAGMRLADHGF
jgi:hypothetical protein